MSMRRWACVIGLGLSAALPAGSLAAQAGPDEEESGTFDRLEGSIAVGRGRTSGVAATGARLGGGLRFGVVRVRVEAQAVGFDQQCTATLPPVCNVRATSLVTVDGGLDVVAPVWQDRLRPYAGAGVGAAQWQNDVISGDGLLRAGLDVRVRAPIWLRAELRRDTSLSGSNGGPTFTMVWLGLRFGD